MTQLLYMDDSYLKEFNARILKTGRDERGNFIILDRTAFYPSGGGVPHDTGKIILENGEVNVIDVRKDLNTGNVKHYIDSNAENLNGNVRGIIKWERRYRLMRMHTAAHLISGIINKEEGCLITGNQINIDKTRIDFNFENFDREKIDHYFQKANELISKDLAIKIYYMDREEAFKDKGMFKLANKLPPNVEKLRIVEIENFDRQPDGGCHVKSLKELGKLIFLKHDNRGKNNRRIYFTLEDYG